MPGLIVSKLIFSGYTSHTTVPSLNFRALVPCSEHTNCNPSCSPMSHLAFAQLSLHAPPPPPPVDTRDTGGPLRLYWTDMRLVEMRQARALAGLDTSEMDVEIAERVIANPAAWGRIGQYMTLLHLRATLESRHGLIEDGGQRRSQAHVAVIRRNQQSAHVDWIWSRRLDG
jgi:hypothetical protein